MSRRGQQGVVLIAMLALVAMSAAWFTVRRLNELSSDYTIANRNQNAAVLARAKQALMGYVAHQAAISGEDNPGAFPCPEAPGSFNSGAGTDGRTQSPSCPLPAVGRFPWRTIGSEQFVDAAGEPLWYVVASGWAKPGVAGNTVINSNCNDPASGLACWNGQLTVDGVANAAVALIIAPGPAITVPAGACAAWAQTRPTAAPPDLRNYFECENATSPADASFVTTGPASSFNDQVITIGAAEILPLIEGAVADRLQKEFGTQMKAAYYGGLWTTTPVGSTGVLPFAAPFSDPTISDFKGGLGTLQGLPPLNHAFTDSSGSAPVACALAGDNLCDPGFVAWQSATITRTAGGQLGSYNCAVAGTPSVMTCTIYTYDLLLPNNSMTFDLTLRASNVGMALRQINSAVTINGLDNAYNAPMGYSATAGASVINNDGSASIVLSARIPQGGGGPLAPLINPLCGLLSQLLGLGCFRHTVTIPMALLSDHPLVDPANSSYSWFRRNRWHEVAYYAIAAGMAPDSAARSCNPCLNVTYHPDNGKPRAIMLLAGGKIGAQIRPPTMVSHLFEDANAVGVSPFTLRAPALPARTFNDHIAVLDANP